MNTSVNYNLSLIQMCIMWKDLLGVIGTKFKEVASQLERKGRENCIVYPN